MKSQLRALIEQGIANLRAQGTLPADLATPDFVVERPKDRSHGDFATNVAMTLAKPARSNPRAVAQALIDALPANDDIAAVEIAGPGFLNFRLSPAAWQRQLRAVHANGANYGHNASGGGRTAGVEYVSANPTGPLHVGHGRAAAIGDCIARVLDANGWDVRREFYYNDAGVQIENLARSTQARASSGFCSRARAPPSTLTGTENRAKMSRSRQAPRRLPYSKTDSTSGTLRPALVSTPMSFSIPSDTGSPLNIVDSPPPSTLRLKLTAIRALPGQWGLGGISP